MNLKKGTIVYIITVLVSILFIWWGNGYATKDYEFLSGEHTEATCIGIITNIIDSEEYDYGNDMGGKRITFECDIIKGKEKGNTVTAVQIIDDYDQIPAREIEDGEKIVLYDYGEDGWQFTDYVRTTPLIWLGGIFFVLLIVFGRKKGINTIVSLVFTCLGIFMVFIPAVLSGYNVYFWSILICIFTITMTLLIVNGADKKSLAAGIGCICGVMLAGGLTLLMNSCLLLTGIVDESAYYLTMLNPDRPLDLKGVIFAAIIIGAMGAIMDVAMSIASSLHEINEKADVTPRELIGSGFAIGRDMMGTMANTLILAYIGSSLSVTLLLIAYNGSIMELFNKERVIVEILQALVGSIGILFTIPFTTGVCTLLFKNKAEEEYDWEINEEEWKI